jgi:uncharacterized alkaline shock family protein YloU
MEEEKKGAIRISPQVLATIARLTTLSVPGVAQLYHDFSADLGRLFKGRSGGGGVSVDVIDDAVQVDLGIIAKKGYNLYELGREIQSRVARAIKDMIGMPVLAVNVYIADVDMSGEDD